SRARLHLESAQPVRVAGVKSREQLERDATTQPAVLGEVDFAHPSHSEHLGNLVSPKLSSYKRFALAIDHKLGGRFEDGRLDEAAGFIVRVDQRLDFAAQRTISLACLIEKRRALRLAAIERSLKNAVDLFPAFG